MTRATSWPQSFSELTAEQERLGAAVPFPWSFGDRAVVSAGCFLCFPRGQSGYGAEGDAAWVGAALIGTDGRVRTYLVEGKAGARYRAGLLALREGALLEAAVRGLGGRPEVLLVNATGRDHPRRAGLALHLGAILDLPTVGVTHRTLIAVGDFPSDERGAFAPLTVGSERVGYWVRTRSGSRPLAVHAAWRTDVETARRVVISCCSSGLRTPEPIRQARRVARIARYRAEMR